MDFGCWLKIPAVTPIGNNGQRQTKSQHEPEAASPRETLFRVRKANGVAKEVVKGLGRSEVLQRTVSANEKWSGRNAWAPSRNEMSQPAKLTEAQTDRIIQMAWEDRTTFDAIRIQFGLEPGQVIKLMRKKMKPASFRLWRARTAGRDTKHQSKRSFKVGRFRCKAQRG